MSFFSHKKVSENEKMKDAFKVFQTGVSQTFSDHIPFVGNVLSPRTNYRNSLIPI